MLKALAGLNAICLLIVLLCFSIEIPTFSISFYSAEYDKYNIPEQIQVPKDELMAVTERLLAYMKGKAPDLVIEAGVAGERREFFNKREKDHMIDVKNLISVVSALRVAAATVIAASFLILKVMGVKFLKTFALAVNYVFIGFVLMVAGLTAIIALNFEKAFVIFHEIFFDNDLWILNPDTDLLVNIVPTGFFMDISAVICAIFLGLCFFVITVSIVYTKFITNREPPS